MMTSSGWRSSPIHLGLAALTASTTSVSRLARLRSLLCRTFLATRNVRSSSSYVDRTVLTAFWMASVLALQVSCTGSRRKRKRLRCDWHSFRSLKMDVVSRPGSSTVVLTKKFPATSVLIFLNRLGRFDDSFSSFSSSASSSSTSFTIPSSFFSGPQSLSAYSFKSS
uniref:Secreted protein n=1 Tax=Ixodes ricinus TaxID=34613 RepID=A0A6B0UYL8_IXORI